MQTSELSRLSQQQQPYQDPDTYQTIHTDPIDESDQAMPIDNPVYASQHQLDQPLQCLNRCIQSQEDKLSGLEKDAMHWLQGTGQNEKREVSRTQDGIIAESTLKSNEIDPDDTDMTTPLLLGIATIGLAAFVLNELTTFIKANPEAIIVVLLVLLAGVFLLKKDKKGQ